MTRTNITYHKIILVALLFVVGCKSESTSYALGSVKKRNWYEPIPFGMTYVKQGSYRIGASDEKANGQHGETKTISVNSFWMDATEITNSEYQQYVRWVRDSIAAYLTFDAGLDYYKASDRDNNPYDPVRIDWEKIPEIWTDDNVAVKQALQALYFDDQNKFNNSNDIDFHKLNYNYQYIDFQKAALRENSYNYQTQSYGGGINSRADFFVRDNRIPVYPDTLVWIRDFSYSYNEPWTLCYFSHPAYKDYPVVGVTWEQAKAFCDWRTKIKEEFLSTIKIPMIHPYRLPTEAEWEYAARGGQLNGIYPWGGYYTTTEKGCYVANFKPKRGNYICDSNNSSKTMKVGSFDPNAFGLYDMAGNVAEWTSTAYNELGYQMLHDMNPEFQYNAKLTDPPALKRKVVRGGSWKDVSYYIQVSTRDYNYQDSANSYTGFRCVMNAIEDLSKKSTYK